MKGEAAVEGYLQLMETDPESSDEWMEVLKWFIRQIRKDFFTLAYS